MRGLAYLHAGLERVAAADRHRWDFCGLGDDPQANSLNLASAIARHSPAVVVLGGHGAESEPPGVVLADGPWNGRGADLRHLDLLLLVACAVGRLRQHGGRDVEGLYAELVRHGGRCVVAARWPIADLEAAHFATAFVDQYLRNLRAGVPFARARALNQACRDRVGPADGVTAHLAAAFALYGAG
jgi:CHAT domain-containing protein